MTDKLLAISAFARRVGLTPSALRFYDDCGLLRPAEVDEQNGYRYYSPEQEARAALLRDLREIDLPLAEVRVVFDEGPAEGAAVVRVHLRKVEGKADAGPASRGTDPGLAAGGALRVRGHAGRRGTGQRDPAGRGRGRRD